MIDLLENCFKYFFLLLAAFFNLLRAIVTALEFNFKTNKKDDLYKKSEKADKIEMHLKLLVNCSGEK